MVIKRHSSGTGWVVFKVADPHTSYYKVVKSTVYKRNYRVLTHDPEKGTGAMLGYAINFISFKRALTSILETEV